jgi:hypothetical protein
MEQRGSNGACLDEILYLNISRKTLDKIQLSQKLNKSNGTVVKMLCYNSEGRWFDPSWCHWNFSLT